MLWGDEDLIRNPVGSTYPSKNQIQTTVADQMVDENSLYQYYCKLISVRHSYPAIARGTYSAVSGRHSNVGGFLIEYEGEKIGLFHNTSTEEITVDLSECTGLEEYTFSKLCDYIGMGKAKLKGNLLTIGPQTSVVLN